jgi:hypothetical protein
MTSDQPDIVTYSVTVSGVIEKTPAGMFARSFLS